MIYKVTIKVDQEGLFSPFAISEISVESDLNVDALRNKLLKVVKKEMNLL